MGVNSLPKTVTRQHYVGRDEKATFYVTLFSHATQQRKLTTAKQTSILSSKIENETGVKLPMFSRHT